ncbi:hypothetical protein [Maribacter litoralis]|uniref:Lipoprotein n=1 Tax=Maribacter litoralis TaxID=2059726 RepID=A0A653W6D0_9FLAO|nr:hypothetical protein [Maribacter litoralis]VXC07773.1 conserved hypothetical protein [Maribacter litoralis]|eukprot:TRINITY_DN35210_c0_g1_i1.p1 TRINITY_DN35210_c0_g1~~TRINITY_DN35210_c0_g1_i1.p1  ORF type:complete len:192 (-),score=3.35 TRINITY_DN35210_c0_g1_i1:30-605(-)
MKKLIIPIMALAIVSSCNIKKEEKGELPEVDVDVSADSGELPEYDVNWADIDVGTTTKTVKVPKPMIVMEEEEVEVPVIDFDMPGEDKEQRTIMVEAEVSDSEHDLDIQEIRATENRLYVISKLEKLDTDLGEQKMRIQDQVELNAPDLDVKHIIVGEKADNILNNQYKYVNSMNDLDDKIKNAKVIYSDS